MSDRTYDYERDREPIREPEADAPAERASENVFDGWPEPAPDDPDKGESPSEPEPASQPEPEQELSEAEASEQPSADRRASWRPARAPDPNEPLAAEVEPASLTAAVSELEQSGGWDDDAGPPAEDAEPSEDNVIDEPSGVMGTSEHAPGELMIPPGVPVLEGEARGERRAVGIVVSRFNGEVTSKLLEGALAELEVRGVDTNSITVMPVPGAFELPIAAMALAKTRRFACIVALGCVIRGDTPHFDYVSGEAASGLQLAAIETGVPVAFGVLTLDRQDQAEARLDKGAEAVRTGLEMADVFANLRAAAAR